MFKRDLSIQEPTWRVLICKCVIQFVDAFLSIESDVVCKKQMKPSQKKHNGEAPTINQERNQSELILKPH